METSNQPKVSQTDINEYVNSAQDFTQINSKWLQNILAKIKSTYKENKQLREKYPNEPLNFLESEEELDKAIIELCNITQSESPLFNELVKISGDLIIKLLNHPNEQITDSLVQFFIETFDPSYKQDQTEFLKFIMENYVDERILKLHYTKDSESRPEFEALEALLNYNDNEINHYILHNENLFLILNDVINSGNIDHSETAIDLVYKIATIEDGTFVQNYPQIIDTLLIQINNHRSLESKRSETFVEAISYLLRLLSSSTKQGNDAFLHYQGFELMTKLLETGKHIAVSIYLDLTYPLIEAWFNEGVHVKYALKGINSNNLLKYIFGNIKKTYDDDELHKALRYLSRLAALLPFGSTERIRYICKFTSKDFKNLRLLNTIESRYKPTQVHWDDSYDGDVWRNEDYFVSLSEGLEIVQRINLIKAWLLVEDQGIRSKIENEKLTDPQSVKLVVKGFRDHLADDLKSVEDEKRKVVETNEVEDLDKLLDLI